MVRFTPLADVRVLSVTALLQRLLDEGAGASPIDVASASWAEVAQLVADNYDNFWHKLVNILNTPEEIKKFFIPIGTATDVAINENYGTRPVFGIGEPTNPVLVPNNLTVGVSISKLTIDKAAISTYAMSPSYWYQAELQRASLELMLATQADILGIDMPFHTYLVIRDAELEAQPNDPIEAINNPLLIEFLPTNYAYRVTAGNALITHTVNGEGKVLRLFDLLKIAVQSIVTG